MVHQNEQVIARKYFLDENKDNKNELLDYQMILDQ
jgi:hypothetical protein